MLGFLCVWHGLLLSYSSILVPPRTSPILYHANDDDDKSVSPRWVFFSCGLVVLLLSAGAAVLINPCSMALKVDVTY